MTLEDGDERAGGHERGLDGIAQDSDSSLVVAQNGASGRILRVSTSREVSVVATSLDGAASVAFGPLGTKPATYVTLSAFITAGQPGASPAFARIVTH